jgi:uncharacterized SAM-binding protein YcdF (DUF218 family)
VGVAAATLVVTFGVATALLFVRPSQGVPARVNAIVMLDGPGNRLTTARALARRHTAPLLLISLGTPYSNTGNTCPAGFRGIRVVCFNPKPATTRGEAEYVGRLARRFHWRSIVLVAMTPQITPARTWLSRCSGPGTTVYAVGVRLPASQWPGALLHEWGALINAELIQRSC